MATPAPTAPPVKTSTAAMVGMILAVAVIFIVIFGYILFLAPWELTARLWWTGFVGFVFAFIAYLIYAGTEAKPIRLLAAGLFVIGVGSYYGAILTGDPNSVLLWLVVLSVFVLIIFGFVFVMARQGEATQARLARRRLTP